MYLNDLNSAQHNVKKLNRVLADTFNHEIDLSENKKIKIIASSSDINSKFLQKLGNF